MARLQDKIQNGLMESRLFVLATQVMLGIQLKVHFEERYDQLPQLTRYVKAGGLVLIVIAFTLVVLPSMFHRIAESGEDTFRVNHFVTSALRWAPLPFVIAVGTDFFVLGERLYSRPVGLGMAVGITALGLLALELFPMLARKRRRDEIDRKVEMSKQEEKHEGTPIHAKINHVLTESRVVLPGAQALLGFQFVVILTRGFEELPQSSKNLHLVAFCLVAVATVLLMTPAVYHRVVERGEETQHFHSLASRILVIATVPIGLAIALDCFVLLRRATESTLLAASIAAALWALMASLWYGLTFAARRRHDPVRAPNRGRAAPARPPP